MQHVDTKVSVAKEEAVTPIVPPVPTEYSNETPENRPADSAAAGSSQVVETNVTHIRASGGWRAINLAENWRYRELLYFLTLRDIKLRYKQTALGVVWAIIQPLFTTIVFVIFFGNVGGMAAKTGTTAPYALLVVEGIYAGIEGRVQDEAGSEDLRVCVEVSLLGRGVSVAVERWMIKILDS